MDSFASTEVPAASSQTAKKGKAKGTAKKKSKATKGGRPDEDLFGNTDDIFGDLPAPTGKSPKPKKKKKKTTSTADEVVDGTSQRSG